MAQAGTAYVAVEGDFSKFHAQSQGAMGKFEASFSSLGKKVAGGIAAYFTFDALKSGLEASIKLFEETRRVGAQTNAVIKSTGGVANVSAKQVHALAQSLAAKVGIDDEAIQSGQNLLLNFANVRNETGKGNDIFNQATVAMVDMSVAMGTSMNGAALKMGKALNDPIKGLTSLARAGVTFTDQQKKQVKAMVESGDILGAQQIIMDGVMKRFGGSAAAQATEMDKLKVHLHDLGSTIGSVFVPLMEKGAEAINKFLQSEGFKKFVADVGAEFQKLKDSGVFKFIGDTLGAWVQSQLETARSLIRILQGVIDFVAGVFTGDWGRAWDGIKTIFGNVWDIMARLATKVWEGWKTEASVAFRVLISGLQALGPALLALGGLLVQQLLAGLAALPGALVALTKLAWEGVKAATALAWTGIKAVVGLAWDGIKALISAAAGLIANAVSAAWNLVRSVTGTAWSAITGLVSSAVTTLRNAVATGISAIVGVVTGVWNSIRTATTTAWAAIRTAITSAVSTIAGAVSSAFGAVVAAVRTGVTAAVTTVTGFAGRFLAAGKSLITSLISGISSIIGNAVAKLRTFGENGVATIRGFVGQFFSAGTQIIQGLINGILSMARRVADAAASIASGAKNAVTSFFGSHSPSRLMHAVGIDVMQGMANGITSQRAAIVAALEKGLLGPVRSAISLAQKMVNKAKLDLASALASITTSSVDDIAAATKQVSYWQTKLANATTTADKLAAAQGLKTAIDEKNALLDAADAAKAQAAGPMKSSSDIMNIVTGIADDVYQALRAGTITVDQAYVHVNYAVGQALEGVYGALSAADFNKLSGDVKLGEGVFAPYKRNAAGVTAFDQQFLGGFATGGVLPSDGFYYGHKGEAVVSNPPTSGGLARGLNDATNPGMIVIEKLELSIGGQVVDERIDARMKYRGRSTTAQFNAGVRP